ncbi:MAG: glycerophosphodiester phosphodiesterase [Flavobacteriales bacterium]|jgi:glycerophosphoryl diester phosphodiesterase|nr:glycerophosphodiester phosphodiesterase [Flavobacteriales bacterium]MBK7943528.1 glycerophosphodiester phosphodiesterase [Flavobacteriales bacterium]MBK8950658.1 glycerophosphodiester phosphodiesterase [Flavobacteriales bacterium]MBK9699785.1 glycerophosphodiester phosphodiesterase [Flavobacteriales bacterium]
MPNPRALPALTLLLSACMTSAPEPPEVHGHRGCRGLEPENTIAAFQRAARLGCTWLELDVVLTADGHVLVSHEPWMDHRICTGPDGAPLTEDQGLALNIHRMTLAEAQRCDCGSLTHPDFPDQDNRRAIKPTLAEVVAAIEELTLTEGVGPVSYNIEIKSDPAWYGTYQPAPDTLAAAVLRTLTDLQLGANCLVQSFDPAVLEAVHAQDPGLRTALLVESGTDPDTELARLSYVPEVYSPQFGLVDAAAVRSLQERNIEVVVWTVNEEADLRRMTALGVDGIISDFPDRVLRILEEGE